MVTLIIDSCCDIAKTSDRTPVVALNMLNEAVHYTLVATTRRTMRQLPGSTTRCIIGQLPGNTTRCAIRQLPGNLVTQQMLF